MSPKAMRRAVKGLLADRPRTISEVREILMRDPQRVRSAFGVLSRRDEIVKMSDGKRWRLR